MTYWTVIGVNTGVAWPQKETELTFKNRKFLLKPETASHAPSICLNSDNDENRDEDMTLCREFMSSLAWTEHKPVREEMVCGNGGERPIMVGKGPKWQCIKALKFKCDYLPELTDDKSNLALAIYREALNVSSAPYSFLGFFKIINIIKPHGNSQKKWINDNVGKITDYYAVEKLKELMKVTTNIGDHLYHSGRCAIAHAFSGVIVNPDDVSDTRRLHQELPIIQALAELAIEQELGVKSRSTIWKEHLYELDGFKQIVPNDLREILKRKESISTNIEISFPKMTVGIRNKPDYSGFTSMDFKCIDIADGVLVLHGTSEDGLIEMFLGLNFADERLKYDILNAVRIRNDGSIQSIEYAISHKRFMIDLLCNGEFIVKDTTTSKTLGRTDPFIAVNIDLTKTIESFENQIKELEAMKDAVKP